MVTITDIAKEVGVAPQVVSRVLHGGKSTASARLEIREKIKDVAALRGYRPSAAGQMLRKGSFHSIGILLGNADDFLLSQQSLAGLASGLAKRNYTATLFYINGTSESDLLDSRLVASQLTDALVIPYVRPPSRRLIKALASTRMPVIWMNRRTRHDAVSMDEAGAGAQLLTHLYHQGHRRVTFVDYSGNGDDPHTQERLKGFKAKAKSLNVPITVVAQRTLRQDRAKAAQIFLKKAKKPSALVINSLSAAQVFLQVAVRMGLRIPHDLALASFDDGQHYSANAPYITCAIRPDFTFGHVTAELILQRLEKRDRPLPSRRVPFELITGGTTVPLMHDLFLK